MSLLQLSRGLPLRLLPCGIQRRACRAILTVIWSPKCVTDPCPFSAGQLLSHRRLSCDFSQASVADSGRPINSKDSTHASINEAL